MKTTKAQVIEVARKTAAWATECQQENYAKALSWIESLPEELIPDYGHHPAGPQAGATVSYNLLFREWYDVTNSTQGSKTWRSPRGIIRGGHLVARQAKTIKRAVTGGNYAKIDQAEPED